MSPKRRRTLREGDYYRLGRTIRSQVLAHYERDSCIATVAATLETLTQLNVDAFALKVEVFIVNDILWRTAIERGGEFPAWGDDDYPAGGYGLGVGVKGTPTLPGEWNGHLVAIAERKWLLDYSIDQASRPEHGIALSQPLVIPVEEPFLRRTGERVVYQHGASHLYYVSQPREKDFKETANWLEPPKVSFAPPRARPAAGAAGRSSRGPLGPSRVSPSK